MTRPTVKIHNASTDEIVEREMNDVEFAEFETIKAQEEAAQAEAEAKATARAAILDRLGLTAEEAQLLLGGN